MFLNISSMNNFDHWNWVIKYQKNQKQRAEAFFYRGNYYRHTRTYQWALEHFQQAQKLEFKNHEIPSLTSSMREKALKMHASTSQDELAQTDLTEPEDDFDVVKEQTRLALVIVSVAFEV